MDPADVNTVEEAYSLIDNAGLPHPSGALLTCFVDQALDPQLAADYVLQACRSGHDHRADLLSLVSDWTYIVESVSEYGCLPPVPDAAAVADITRRDGSRCCITGKDGSFWDPLIVLPLLAIPSRWTQDEPRIFNMLGAFLGPAYRDWWLAYVRQPKRMGFYLNHWLVRKSAACAFQKGLVRLAGLRSSVIEYRVEHVLLGTFDGPIKLNGSYPLLGDHSRSMIQKVDPRFVWSQARLSASIRWLNISKQITQDQKVRSSSSTAQRGHPPVHPQDNPSRASSVWTPLEDACLALWLMVPGRARVATYKMLQRLGQRLYGKSGSSCVQRLPFGLYLKSLRDPDGIRNEYNALRLVRQYTSIPVARPIDLVSLPAAGSTEPSDSNDDDVYLITSQIPGRPLSDCHEMITDQDGIEFVTQMQGYLTQLRSIPKTVSPEFAICNTLGGACADPRIRDGNSVGPFVDEEAFSQLLRYPDSPSRRGHEIVFTHADLNYRNIMVDKFANGWRVTGIVDWENAGYYPEYWDYTKALFEGFRWPQRLCNFMHDIFRPFGDISKELEIEKRSWEEGDAA